MSESDGVTKEPRIGFRGVCVRVLDLLMTLTLSELQYRFEDEPTQILCTLFPKTGLQ